jgi:hypothetical protein
LTTKKQRTSTLVDWAFIALDRGMPRKEVARLAWLYVELEDAVAAIHSATRQSHIDEGYKTINAIKRELGLPIIEAESYHRYEIETACNLIFHRLTGMSELLMVENDGPLKGRK